MRSRVASCARCGWGRLSDEIGHGATEHMGIVMGAFLLWLVFLMSSYFYVGFVFSRLWAWFVVPVFGLPYLTVVQAVGINLVVNFLMARYPKDESKIEDGQLVKVDGVDAITKRATWLLLYVSFTWGVGWCWHRWIQ